MTHSAIAVPLFTPQVNHNQLYMKWPLLYANGNYFMLLAEHCRSSSKEDTPAKKKPYFIVHTNSHCSDDLVSVDRRLPW